jgi:4-alpha-glucanotransferase
LLISPDKLIEENLLKPADISHIPHFSQETVNFEDVIEYKNYLLVKSWEYFKSEADPHIKGEFESFCSDNDWWLEDYSLFMALKEFNGSIIWNKWPDNMKWREPATIESYKVQLKKSIEYFKFQQFLFRRQWSSIKKYCNDRNIRFIGDMPVFVNIDSDSVWTHPQLFQIDNNGQASLVAGVPPDYFSKTGQLWGNPLYKWDEMERSHYSWWIDRLRATFNLVDILRIDHFRGFESYWEIPGNAETAVNGGWVKGPGLKLFQASEIALGPLPIIAEDLGIITDEVRQLRDKLNFPGMRVLQFAFNEDKLNEHKPYNYVKNCVVYTGTHDNNTSVGWFAGDDKSTMSNEQKLRERQYTLKYLGTDGKEINWDLIRLAHSSIADTCIVPFQDVLGLGSNARMNTPGVPKGNWNWRFSSDMLTNTMKSRLKEMTWTYGR